MTATTTSNFRLRLQELIQPALLTYEQASGGIFEVMTVLNGSLSSHLMATSYLAPANDNIEKTAIELW